jgi:hypothetical protein
MAVLMATNFSSQRGALHGVKLTKHGTHAAPGVLSIGRLAEEGDARPLQVRYGLDGVNGVVEWCAQVHDGDI